MRKKNCTLGIYSGNTDEMVKYVYLPREIVIDILTRLPAKVVGQCKCICKHWRTLIEDPMFAELHHNRAKCRPDSCYLLISFSPAINFDKIDFFAVGYEGGSAQRLLTFPTQAEGWYHIRHIKQSVNGLICGYLTKPRTIFIVNPTTKEVVTLPRSSMPTGNCPYSFHHRSAFGFDPSTKQYKVFNISPNLHPSANEEFPEYSYYQYEIFTLGTHSWRKIDAVPPSPHFPFGFGGICVNGVIHWTSTSRKPSSTIDKEVIVAFDLKDEKFRVIPLPEGPSVMPRLRELGGHLAACEDYPENVPEEVWILEDYENWVWVKVIITPPRDFDIADGFLTNGAIQTGDILLHTPPESCSFPTSVGIYYYDWKKSSVRRIDITGLPLSEFIDPRVLTCNNLISFRFTGSEKRSSVWWEVGVKTAVVNGGASWGFPAVVAVRPLLEFSANHLFSTWTLPNQAPLLEVCSWNLKPNAMRKKKCTRGISSGNTGEMVNDVYLPHEIVIDILTRLPARVVGQCKCICKHWRALIEDPTFAELHHNRAKCRPDSCYLVISFSPAINFDKIDFFSVGYEGGSAQRLFTFPIQEKGWYHIKQSVNGLICGYLIKPRTIFIVNPTTKEVVTLPQSSMSTGIFRFFGHPRLSFGFDPSTKQYKVLNVSPNLHPSATKRYKVFNVSPNLHPSANTEFAEYSYQYEIFTLGTHSWRKIDVVPPPPHFPFGFGGICVNGVIHWRSTSMKPSSTIDKEVIVAFDLKDERFRVISLPEGPSAKPCLRELGGHLAACEDFPEDVPEELWILEDYENWVWVKVIIMPPSDFVIVDGFQTNGAIQTGEILLYSPPMSPYCLLTTLFDIYYYNRKKSSVRRIDITGLPLSEFMGPRGAY
ncbi:hypothetical protein C3L33_02798, partial [Rhododendron williamsianum]